MEPDELAKKFAELNAEVSKELQRVGIRECIDQMVLDGDLGYDLETDEYCLLPGDGSEAQ